MHTAPYDSIVSTSVAEVAEREGERGRSTSRWGAVSEGLELGVLLR